VSLRPDGLVQILSPRQEMGQGVSTAFRQIVAEELGVPLDRVLLILPRTDLLPVTPSTVGSDSMAEYSPLLARAAATLRETLRSRAAKRAGVAASSVEEAAGGFRLPNGERVGFAALAQTSGRVVTAADALPGMVLRSMSGPEHPRRIVGRSVPTDRIEAIVGGGEVLYAGDVTRPGLVEASLVRPPQLGASLRGFDDRPARLVPGFIAALPLATGVAVVAETRGAVERAVAALDARWSVPDQPVTQKAVDAAIDIDKHLLAGSLEHSVLRQGRLGSGQAPWDVDLRVDVPMAAHAGIEPRCAVAEFRTNGSPRLEVWTGTQDAFYVRAVLADALGLSEADVVVHSMRLGGSFGGRTICTVELEAAQLARQIGRPVKVRWSRPDEFQHGFHRPPSSHRIRGRLDAEGRILDWWHAFASGHVIFTSAAMPPLLQTVTSLVADPGVGRGANLPYAVRRAARVEFADVRLPVATGPWRGLGAGPNVFAIEVAIDTLARRAGLDPLAFRLNNLDASQARLRRVLERVAERAGWAGRPRAGQRRYGLACGVYKETAYAAVVAEVSVGRVGSAPRVTRLWCAHDSGLVINPDQVRAQVEGNLVWGLGMALGEELQVRDGRIGTDYFTDYALPRFSDVPAMTIDLVQGGEAPSRAGETAIVAAAAAIANALAGDRAEAVRRLPLHGQRGAG
jgi:CO/xanthine dehydrogenase Mo-binding subunit